MKSQQHRANNTFRHQIANYDCYYFMRSHNKIKQTQICIVKITYIRSNSLARCWAFIGHQFIMFGSIHALKITKTISMFSGLYMYSRTKQGWTLRARGKEEKIFSTWNRNKEMEKKVKIEKFFCIMGKKFSLPDNFFLSISFRIFHCYLLFLTSKIFFLCLLFRFSQFVGS